MKFGELNSFIFDSLYDLVLISDKDNNVIYVNPAYTRITKVEAKDIIERKIGEVRIGSRLLKI